MEESDEELVAVESVKDSTESSKSQYPGGRGSNAEGIGKGAEQILAEPVANPVHASESESLKSAQSDVLSGDSSRKLVPSAKTLAGSSVKEKPMKHCKNEVEPLFLSLRPFKQKLLSKRIFSPGHEHLGKFHEHL